LAPTTHTNNPTTEKYVKQWLIMLLAINQPQSVQQKLMRHQASLSQFNDYPLVLLNGL